MVENEDSELRQRVCRSCNEEYVYPVPHSAATRFHCEACAEMPAEVRAVLEKYNRRLKTLTAAIEKLEKRCQGLEGGRQGDQQS